MRPIIHGLEAAIFTAQVVVYLTNRLITHTTYPAQGCNQTLRTGYLSFIAIRP